MHNWCGLTHRELKRLSGVEPVLLVCGDDHHEVRRILMGIDSPEEHAGIVAIMQGECEPQEIITHLRLRGYRVVHEEWIAEPDLTVATFRRIVNG